MKAYNDFVLIIRDEAEEKTSGGFIIPGVAIVKPAIGKVHSVGKSSKDADVRGSVGKKIMFHKDIGFEIKHGGVTYVVIKAHEIIAAI